MRIQDSFDKDSTKGNFLKPTSYLDVDFRPRFASHLVENIEMKTNIKPNSFILLYLYFFKFTSILMLVPFTIEVDSLGNYRIHNSIFRKILCSIHHVIISLTSILQLRRVSAISIKEKPELTFVLADFFCWAVYIWIFSYTVWKKQKNIKKVVNLPIGIPSTKMNIFCGILCCIPIIQILYFKFWLEMFDENESFQEFAESYRGKVLYTWYIHRNISANSDWSLSHKEIDVLCVVTFLMEILYGFSVTYFELFTLIGALCAYVYCSKLPTIETNPQISLQMLEEEFINLEFYLESLNEITTNFLLWTYIQVIPWVAGSFADVIDAEKWGFILFMWGYYMSYSAILVLASEVHYKVQQFIKFIKKKAHQNTSKNVFCPTATIVNYINNTDCLGLEGGRFFVMSYSFLGATISVLLTYVIIVLQFKSSPPKPFS